MVKIGEITLEKVANEHHKLWLFCTFCGFRTMYEVRHFYRYGPPTSTLRDIQRKIECPKCTGSSVYLLPNTYITRKQPWNERIPQRAVVGRRRETRFIDFLISQTVHVKCNRCNRAGAYKLLPLIERWGWQTDTKAWTSEFAKNCPHAKVQEPCYGPYIEEALGIRVLDAWFKAGCPLSWIAGE